MLNSFEGLYSSVNLPAVDLVSPKFCCPGAGLLVQPLLSVDSKSTLAITPAIAGRSIWGHALDVKLVLNDALSLKSISADRHDKSPLNNTSSNSTVLPEVFLTNKVFGTPGFGVCPVSHATGFNCSGALTGIDVLYDLTHHQFSQEFQLLGKHDHVDWVLGAFYLKESGSQPQKVYTGAYLPNSVVGFLPPPFPRRLPTDHCPHWPRMVHNSSIPLGRDYCSLKAA